AVAVAQWLTDKKAENVVALDVSASRTFTDGILIASASSFRHAQGLADHVLDQCRDAKYEFLRMEGYQGGEWILIDCNDMIINIFQRDQRDLYRIEELWPQAELLHGSR
ncbi:ribosome silencing factor, partial [Desulfovibrio sp. OttesenSCG-928-I05]|nr:ribosome silencing factor [Desulfovibrio sp. OttesenSCG-928-I05]